MRFIMVSLLVFLFTSVIAQEKDYSLFDYNALSSDRQWHTFYQEIGRLERLSEVNWNAILEAAQRNPHVAINMSLYALEAFPRQYSDIKLRAYRTAECAMLMAKVLELYPLSPARITKSQVKRAWRSNNKDVSRMLAMCRRHPENASVIIEDFKRDLRKKLTQQVAK